MTLTVTHAKNVAIADDPKAAAAGEVLPSDWNANHTVSGTLSSTDITGLPTSRDILTANRSYFVSTTGSDSNGGTNSTTDAWATLQHAFFFIADSIDISSLTVTINVGAGSFAGFGVASTVGGGVILVIGAGAGSTTITAGPNDGIFNFGECWTFNFACESVISIDLVTFTPDNGNSLLGEYVPNCFGVVGNYLTGSGTTTVSTANSPGDIFFIENLCLFQVSGSGNVIAGGGNTASSFWDIANNAIVLDGSTWTISGAADTYGTFAKVRQSGFYISNSTTYTGSANGVRFAIDGVSQAKVADPAGTHFPGNAAGTIAPGGEYTGITDFVGIVANLPTANVQGTRGFVTDALAATFGSAPTGGHALVVPVYNDGTTWLMG